MIREYVDPKKAAEALFSRSDKPAPIRYGDAVEEKPKKRYHRYLRRM